MQAHERHPVGAGEFLRVDALAQARGVGRAALEGEILSTDDAAPAADHAEAEHIVGRREFDQTPLVISGRIARGAAEFLKGAVVEHGVDPFADGEKPLGVLTGDTLLTALPLGELALTRELLGFLFPAHARLTRIRRRREYASSPA